MCLVGALAAARRAGARTRGRSDEVAAATVSRRRVYELALRVAGRPSRPGEPAAGRARNADRS